MFVFFLLKYNVLILKCYIFNNNLIKKGIGIINILIVKNLVVCIKLIKILLK